MTSDTALRPFKPVNRQSDIYTEIAVSRSPWGGIGADAARLEWGIALAKETREARTYVEEFTLADGRRIYLLAEGRLVNISAAEGHPAIVMDMFFANQALAAEYAVQNAATLERRVYPVPTEIDNEIARLKLITMGAEIDELTEEQARYLASWDEGT